LWRMLPVGRKNLAWLMFLPSAIYFSLNRFDILPVYIGLLGVAALKKDRFAVAAALLALGVFTKWYLVLIFPFFLAYELNHTRKLPWRTVLIFLGVSIAIVLPTFIQGGFQAVWQPYSWHLARMVEPGTLLWFLYQLFGHAGEELIKPGILATIFTFLGFGGVILVLFLRFDSIEKVMLASILSLLLFIFVTRIFSPQWWLWVLPFLIITYDKLFDLILIVIYDLTNYAAFPVAYDLSGRDSIESLVLHGVLIALMMVLITRTVWKIHAHDQSPDFRKRILHA
jgi:hypothetical protein